MCVSCYMRVRATIEQENFRSAPFKERVQGAARVAARLGVE